MRKLDLRGDSKRFQCRRDTEHTEWQKMRLNNWKQVMKCLVSCAEQLGFYSNAVRI